MIDKSLRMKVPKQGGVKNYLGKQEMVKAPKKWKSAPNHPDTELAYITKAEKDALIKMNLHGSMNGKAHKGPSGIISLNGWGDADRGYDSPSSGGHDHGGSGEQPWEQSPAYNQPAPAPATIDEPSWTGEEDSSYTGVTPVTYDDSEDDDKAASYVNWDPDILGNVDSDDEYDIPDPTHEKLTQNEINEAIKDLKETGQYDTSLTETQKEQVNKEIATYRGDPIGTKYDLSDKASAQPVFNIKEKTTDFAKSQAKKMARNKVMKELGLAGINPLLTLGSFLLGKFAPNKKAALQSRIDAATKKLIEPREPIDQRFQTYVQRKRTSEQRDSDNLAQAVSGKQDVVSKAIAQYTDKDIATMEQAKNLLKATMQAGTYQGRVLTRQQMVILEDKHNELAKLLEAIKKAQAPIEVATGGRVDKVLTGRSRDI